MRAKQRVVRTVRWGVVGGVVAVVGLIGGCGGSASPVGSGRSDKGVLTIPVPPAAREFRHSVLLGFERDTDPLFVQAPDAAARVAAGRAYSGERGLAISNAQTVDVKLSSLMSGRPFPGDWTLVGGHLYTERAGEVEAAVVVDGAVVLRKRQPLAEGQWNEVMLDLRAMQGQPLVTGATAVLRMTLATPTDVWLDDVMLVDNAQTLVSVDGGWTIRRQGHAFVLDYPRRFRIELKADASQSDAWRLVEAIPPRAIFRQAAGKTWVVYADGRRYEDGVYKPAASTEYNADFAEQHRAPATVAVPEEQGEVLRRTSGDANNDGYNEQLGAYQIAAKGGRLDVKLTPRTTQLVMPVLEITGLPQGKLVVTIEGELLTTPHRREDGSVLIVVPHKMGRAVMVNVRVQ